MEEQTILGWHKMAVRGWPVSLGGEICFTACSYPFPKSKVNLSGICCSPDKTVINVILFSLFDPT